MKASHKAILWVAIPIILIAFFIWLNWKWFLIGLLIGAGLFCISALLYAIYRAVLDKVEEVEEKKRRERRRKEWEKEQEERKREAREVPTFATASREGTPGGSGSYHTQPEVKATFRRTIGSTDSF